MTSLMDDGDSFGPDELFSAVVVVAAIVVVVMDDDDGICFGISCFKYATGSMS